MRNSQRKVCFQSQAILILVLSLSIGMTPILSQHFEDVTMEVSLDPASVVLPPGGGEVSLLLTASNDGKSDYQGEMWLTLELPNDFVELTIPPKEVRIRSNSSNSIERSISIPGHYPTGLYELNLYWTLHSIEGAECIGTAYASFEKLAPGLELPNNIALLADNNIDGLMLSQNYPNPFNPSTMIEFELAAPQTTSLIVYNALGQSVVELVNGYLQAGPHTVSWDGKNAFGERVGSGIYFYQLRTIADGKPYVETRRMYLMR